jgi:hypothetical protein
MEISEDGRDRRGCRWSALASKDASRLHSELRTATPPVAAARAVSGDELSEVKAMMSAPKVLAKPRAIKSAA